ncbi:methyltransferase domain-containing protein [Pseudodesulfovibrio sp. JC047]|uniref:class I SAM-dependent methyltransferase n=1 Tax=Pseudodesulfovibrio sp. JC047 TaxID=2683199 RepID=UPI0013D027A3|nr:methyltransferase domain-containing protein [Pseudodesulfovibrio sp. JC047]NDV19087.1 methyltransferase domain-containing protein [Pseudodesulfovibrio sp. JC047]
MNESKHILDACCGGRMFHFDKQNPEVLFTDIRKEEHTLCDGRSFTVSPDTIEDFRDMSFEDEAFNLVIFDPPHLVRAGDNSWMKAKYGRLDRDNWKDDIQKGFAECWRVLKTGGTLIFKWNETQIKLAELRPLFPARPICGHTTTVNLKTHWIVFYKTV